MEGQGWGGVWGHRNWAQLVRLMNLNLLKDMSRQSGGCWALAVWLVWIWGAVVVQSPSGVWLFVTPWTAGAQASLSLIVSQSLPKLMSIELVMPSSYLIFWCPLLLLPSIFPSIRDFSNELAVCIRWPKYWSVSFSISPSSKYSGLISLKIWLVWSPCCPRDSKESSPTLQFEGINSSALGLL